METKFKLGRVIIFFQNYDSFGEIVWLGLEFNNQKFSFQEKPWKESGIRIFSSLVFVCMSCLRGKNESEIE